MLFVQGQSFCSLVVFPPISRVLLDVVQVVYMLLQLHLLLWRCFMLPSVECSQLFMYFYLQTSFCIHIFLLFFHLGPFSIDELGFLPKSQVFLIFLFISGMLRQHLHHIRRGPHAIDICQLHASRLPSSLLSMIFLIGILVSLTGVFHPISCNASCACSHVSSSCTLSPCGHLGATFFAVPMF